MDFDLTRLRRGELLAGAGAALLSVLMLAVHWYGSKTGWQSLTVFRWVALITVLVTAGLVLMQSTRRAPAVPVTLSMFTLLLGLVSVVWLIVRVLIDPPAHRHIGAVLGLLSACLLMFGGWRSFRKEGISRRDEPHDIPLVPLRTGVAAGGPEAGSGGTSE